MTQHVKKASIRFFNRTDSAHEIHGNAPLTKPFAHGSKLADLLDDTAKAVEVQALKEFPLELPPAPPPRARHQDVREALSSVGDNTTASLEAMQEAVAGGFRTMRYVASAAPVTSWGPQVGGEAAQAQLSGQRFIIQDGTRGNATLNRGGAAGAVDCGGGTTFAMSHGVTGSDIGVAGSLGTVGGGTDVLRGDFFGASGMRGASLSDTWTLGSTRLGGSLAAIVIADAKLAPLQWEDGIATQGPRVLAQWETTVMPVIAGDLGVGWMHLGASLRGSAFKSIQNVYQVYVTPEEIGHALRQRHGVLQAARTGLEGLGLKKAPVALPKLNTLLEARQANHLQVGESVRMVRSGNMSVGLTVSAYGCRTGIYGSYTGETELTVARVDDHHLDVVISPKRIVSLSANLDFLVAAEGHTSASIATGLARAFRVDLREETAREALTKLFDDGVYPGCDNTPARPGVNASVDMAQQVRHGNLPVGVRSLFFQRAEHLEADWGMSVPKPFFIPGRVAGVGLAGKMFERNQVTTDGVASLSTKTLGRASQRELGTAGKQYKEVLAGVRRLEVLDVAGRPKERFDGLETKVIKKLTRVIGDARVKITDKVARLMGTSVATPTKKGEAQTYEVTLARLYTHMELAGLGTASSVDRLRVAFKTSVPLSALDRLHDNIAALARKHDSASLTFALNSAAEVQTFMLAHGQRGFAAVHALCGGHQEDIDLTVDSSAFDKPVKKAFSLQLEYGTARDARTLKRGIREAKKVGDTTASGVSHLADDSLLKTFAAPEHKAKLAALRKVHHEVEQFLQRLKERMNVTPAPLEGAARAGG